MEQVSIPCKHPWHCSISFHASSLSQSQLSDRSDPFLYAIRNAPLISLAGVISGFQEAYYKFEVSVEYSHALWGVRV